ncbi:MAG: cohesin domain-containing protein, partial [Clostridiales bacterium]|nr:cohesin domain-containing protein [Clostridiales bacterium]
MKKKPKAIMITGALIAAAAGALAVSGAAAQIVTQNSCDAKLVMTADRTTVTEGDEVTVTIQLTENTGFVSFLADLDYDSEILTLTDFSYTDTLSDWVAPTSYILTGSSMYWDTAYEENTATGALASMTFTVNEGTAGTVTEAGLSMESCLDYDFNQLDVEQEKAEIRIVSDADTLCVNNGKSIYYQQYAITSTIADAEMTCSYAVTPEEVLFGDWDGDGIDTICLRKGNTYYFYNDVNGQTVDSVVSYGSRTDEVLCGDWDGDGADSLC